MSPIVYWPTSEGYITYGSGISDAWNADLTSYDVRSPSFGVALSALSSAKDRTAWVNRYPRHGVLLPAGCPDCHHGWRGREREDQQRHAERPRRRWEASAGGLFLLRRDGRRRRQRQLGHQLLRGLQNRRIPDQSHHPLRQPRVPLPVLRHQRGGGGLVGHGGYLHDHGPEGRIRVRGIERLGRQRERQPGRRNYLGSPPRR